MKAMKWEKKFHKGPQEEPLVSDQILQLFVEDITVENEENPHSLLAEDEIQ
jgi:hypothetical protein